MRFEINIGGQPRTINFNIYAAQELGKILEVEPTPEALMKAILDVNERNSLLMFKALIYTGIIGHDYETSFKASVNQAEVGGWLSNANGDELVDVFNKFADALGFDLKAEEETEKPKKKSRMKKSKAQPLEK